MWSQSIPHNGESCSRGQHNSNQYNLCKESRWALGPASKWYRRASFSACGNSICIRSVLVKGRKKRDQELTHCRITKKKQTILKVKLLSLLFYIYAIMATYPFQSMINTLCYDLTMIQFTVTPHAFSLNDLHSKTDCIYLNTGQDGHWINGTGREWIKLRTIPVTTRRN